MTTQNAVRASAAGIKHKPFNLAEALAGKPVVHIDSGRPVKGIVHYQDAGHEYRVVGLIDGNLRPGTFTESGEVLTGHGAALGMAVEEKTGYVPTKPGTAVRGRTYVPGGYIYETRAAAESANPGYDIAEVKYAA